MSLKSLKRLIEQWQLPAAAKKEVKADRRGLPETDPGAAAVVRANLEWLARAQDRSKSADGGVARDYSLVNGWATSYPETTGYIVPTVIEWARRSGDAAYLKRAERMLDWLAAIQFPEGGIQGGKVDAQPRVPVTFNTGQVLIGFAAGVAQFGDRYRDPMNRAAAWLRDSLDPDGCWRRHPTPFAKAGEKSYETHVAWGLFEAERVEPGRGYGAAGLRQVAWALKNQLQNGWFADCCLNMPAAPLTHTLGYVLRGVLEAHRLKPSAELLSAAQRTADALGSALRKDGFLPGRFHADWRPAVDWVCLTGSVQLAACWIMLYREIGDTRYRDWALRANRYVRRTVRVQGPEDVRGGVKGSFPVDGSYGAHEYLNWAAKFCADAQMMEMDLEPA
jgi:hypothetical protein